MPSFDARTLVLVSFLTTTLFFLSLFVLYKSLAHVLPGLKEGVIAVFGWASGSGLILLRSSIPDFLSVVIGNVLMTSGIWFMLIALHLSLRGPLERRHPIWVMAIAGNVGIACFALFSNYSSFLIYVLVLDAVLYAVCSTLAGRAKPWGLASGMASYALGLGAAISLLRALTLVFGIDVVAKAFEDPTIFQRLYFSFLALAILLATMSFTFMTYERLNKVLVIANTALESDVAARTAELRREIDRKQALERQLSTAAEAERRRIGIELHDDLGQRLTGISLIAEVLSQELSKGSPTLSAHADALQQAASQAIVQVRTLAHGLMPVAPEPEGFGEALAQLAKASSALGRTCKFEYDEPVNIKDPDVATNLFRIAQEAISNAIRHAQARNIALRLEEVEGKVVLSVADDGGGFVWPQPQLQPESGRGMGIMEFRASLIQYRLNVFSAPGRGTLIKATEC